MGLIVFVAVIVALTGVGVFLTERVDRPARRQARLAARQV